MPFAHAVCRDRNAWIISMSRSALSLEIVSSAACTSSPFGRIFGAARTAADALAGVVREAHIADHGHQRQHARAQKRETEIVEREDAARRLAVEERRRAQRYRAARDAETDRPLRGSRAEEST